jgi:hypothetical protein
MLMLTIAGAMVLVAFWMERQTKIPPLDRKDLERHRRISEEKCRDWMYPFE